MFQITKQFIGNEIRHAVVGEAGASLITVLATSEMQACEIARCLNEAAGVEVEDLVETVPAADLHPTLPGLLTCRGFDYADLRDSAPEMNRDGEFDREQV